MLAMLAISMLLGGCSAAGVGSVAGRIARSSPTGAMLRSQLLATSDLAPGWNLLHTTSHGPDRRIQPGEQAFCSSRHLLTLGTSGVAETELRRPPIRLVIESIAGFDRDPATALGPVIDAWDRCHQFQLSGDQAAMSRLALPSMGERSQAYQLHVGIAGHLIRFDMVLVAKGDEALLLVVGGVPSPTTAQVDDIARVALARLP